MSYCRLGADSDVYVYPSYNGGFVCCFCKLIHERTGDGERWDAITAAEMVAHLLEHRAAGHRVPQDALDELEQERKGTP